MRRLTERQEEVLNAIRDFIIKKGYPPTVRELGDLLDLSEKAAHGHLLTLENKGWIERLPDSARAIRIVVDFFKILRDIPEHGLLAGDVIRMQRGELKAVTRLL